jgi:phosphatidylserine/phosphatidylglycerophosphate/cardiolipin synthase-like enzyme
LVSLNRARRAGAWSRAAVFGAVLVVLFVAFLWQSAPESPPAPDPRLSAHLEVRFTRPDPNGPSTLRGGPDADLAQAIDRAETTVDMAIYDLNLWSIRDALLAAKRRGVDVRLVVESDNLASPELAELIAAGIPVVADGAEPLMHDKFTVIDGAEVWTGSMNYTIRDGYRNDNNLVTLRSAEAAAAYHDEFEEMFLDGAFGALSPPGSGLRLHLEDGSAIEIYFAPDDRPLDRLVELIEAAESQVDFLAFAFTSPDLAGAIRARAAAGVRVRGVIESGQAENLGSEWPALRDAGLDVRLDGNPANMHHKVIVIDRSVVVFGSYNLSRSAEYFNDENLVVVHGPAIAARFLAEFERVFAMAR